MTTFEAIRIAKALWDGGEHWGENVGDWKPLEDALEEALRIAEANDHLTSASSYEGQIIRLVHERKDLIEHRLVVNNLLIDIIDLCRIAKDEEAGIIDVIKAKAKLALKRKQNHKDLGGVPRWYKEPK